MKMSILDTLLRIRGANVEIEVGQKYQWANEVPIDCPRRFTIIKIAEDGVDLVSEADVHFFASQGGLKYSIAKGFLELVATEEPTVPETVEIDYLRIIREVSE